MKLAVSAQQNSLDSPFEFRFGNARGFVLYDTSLGDISYIENWTRFNPTQRAGMHLVQMISDQGAQAIITGSIGPKATSALAQTEIIVYPFQGETVREALRAYEKGHLNHIRRTGTQAAVQVGRSSAGQGCDARKNSGYGNTGIK